MKTKPPCYNCEKRTTACHSSCEAFKEWKEQTNRESKIIFEAKCFESALRGMQNWKKKDDYRNYKCYR